MLNRITVFALWQQRDTLLRIHFVGDMARLYAGGKLVADKFYNGQPFDFALRRLPPDQLDTLELRVMPLHPQLAERLPASMRPTPPLPEPRAEVTGIEALATATAESQSSTLPAVIKPMNAINKVRRRTAIPIRQGERLLWSALFAGALGSGSPLLAQAPQAKPPYPDVQGMLREPLDNIPNGKVACGLDALCHRRRGNTNQSNPCTLDGPRLTQIERPVRGDPDDVAAGKGCRNTPRRKTRSPQTRRSVTGPVSRQQFNNERTSSARDA